MTSLKGLLRTTGLVPKQRLVGARARAFIHLLGDGFRWGSARPTNIASTRPLTRRSIIHIRTAAKNLIRHGFRYLGKYINYNRSPRTRAQRAEYGHLGVFALSAAKAIINPRQKLHNPSFLSDNSRQIAAKCRVVRSLQGSDNWAREPL
jgi:hypothetical protein